MTLASADWGVSEPPRPWMSGKEPILDFFKFEESNYQCPWFAPIVDPKYKGKVRAAQASLFANTGQEVHQSLH